MAQDGVRTDGIDDEDSEQDPQGDVHYAVWGKMEEGKAKDVAEFQGKDTKDSPENGILEADVAVHVPFFVGIIPPFAVADPFQDVACDPFGGGGDDHTAEKQKNRAGLQFVQVAGHENSRDSVDGTQRAIQKASVYHVFFPNSRHCRFQKPSKKGIKEEQPEVVVDCVVHQNLLFFVHIGLVTPFL